MPGTKLFMSGEWLEALAAAGERHQPDGGPDAVVQFVVSGDADDHAFHFVLEGGKLAAAADGTHEQPQVVLRMDEATCRSVFRQELSFLDAARDDALTATGDLELAFSLHDLATTPEWSALYREVDEATAYAAS